MAAAAFAGSVATMCCCRNMETWTASLAALKLKSLEAATKKLQFKLKISDKLHSHALGLHQHQIKSISDRRGRFGSACRSWLLGPHVGVRQDLNSLEAAAALPAPPPVPGCVVEHR